MGALKALLGFLFLAGLLGGSIIFFKACPPQGPWPAPPWCGNLTVTVEAPSNTPPHTLVFFQVLKSDGKTSFSQKMDDLGNNKWKITAAFPARELTYRYIRNGWGFTGAEEFSPDSKTGHRTATLTGKAQTIDDSIKKWRWLPEPGFTMPTVFTSAGSVSFVPRINNEEYQKGALIVDFWWENFKILLASTDARLKEKGFTWIEIAPGWDYKQVNPLPVFTNSYTDAGLEFQLQKMKSDSFKIFVAPQLCCTDIGKASFTLAWWDAWFAEYEQFTLYFADKAEKYHADALDVSADWTAATADASKRPADYKERFEAIYAKVREHYHGKLGRSFYLGGSIGGGIPDVWPKESSLPFVDKADFFTVNWWVGIATTNNPSQEELDANVKKILAARLQPLYEKYKKPIVLKQVAYPSIVGGLRGGTGVFDEAIQLWNPYSEKYMLDLIGQAMGYEAVMRAVAATPYIVGMYPFTYWPDDFSLTKEHNIRGKPAEEVLSKWYKSI